MRILAAITLLSLIAGCATVGPPRGYDDAAIKNAEKSIVMFRFAGDIGGMPVKEDDFFIELADIDRYEIPKKYRVKSFITNEGRNKGWAYMLLEPGTYYFTVTPGYASQDDGPESLDSESGMVRRNVFGNMIDLTTFWFDLPKGVPLMYIGTFSFSCAQKNDGSSSGLLCTDIDVYDESEIAGEIAKTSLIRYGAMVTNIIKKYGTCEKDKVSSLMPLRAEISSRISLDPLELIRVSSERTAGPGYGYLAGIPPGMPYSPFFYPDGFLYGYQPRGLSVGVGIYFNNLSIPCFDKVADVIVKSNITGMLEDYLAKGSSKESIASYSQRNVSETGSENKGLLQIDIQRAHLTECNETWTFCAEVEVRKRIFDTSTGMYCCDSLLSYSSAGRGRPRGQGRYVLPVRKDSPCLHLNDWCGSEGSAMLQGQFAEAMKSISHKIIHDLGH